MSMLAREASISALYLQEFSDLRRHIVRKLRDPFEADDVVQEAYIRMLTVPAGHAVLRNAKAFLFTVASNLAVDTVRREQRQRRLLAMSDTSTAFDGETLEVICPRRSTEEQVDASMRLSCILGALDALPANCRQAFTLHKMHELSYAEVAVEMGITVSMVEKHLSRALRHLRSFGNFDG
jgi:RNA polymerase sigma factor (sigma-70 family)